MKFEPATCSQGSAQHVGASDVSASAEMETILNQRLDQFMAKLESKMTNFTLRQSASSFRFLEQGRELHLGTSTRPIGETSVSLSKSARSDALQASKHVAPQVVWDLDDERYLKRAKQQAHKIKQKRTMDHLTTPDERPSCRERVHALVQTGAFELFWFVVIIANAALLGAQVQLSALSMQNDQDFMIANLVLCAFFIVELIIRFVADGGPCAFFIKSPNRGWHWFDTVAVVVTTTDVFLTFLSGGLFSNVRSLRLLRVMRILRAARILKVIQHVAPLRMLLQSILGTFRSLFWAMVLLAVMIYVFSIIFTDAVTSSLPADGKTLYFSDLTTTMLVLFLAISGGIDCWPLSEELILVHWIWSLVFVFYLSMSMFAVLNVMTSIFCQSAVDLAGKDHELVVTSWTESRLSLAKDFEKLFQSLDRESDGVISLQALEEVLQDAWIRDFFAALDIESSDVYTLFKLLDRGGDGVIDGHEFVEGCMKLRGGAKAIDVVATKWEVKCLRQRVAELVTAVSMLAEGVAAQVGGDSAFVEANAPDAIKSQGCRAGSPEAAARPPAVRVGQARQPHLKGHPGDDVEEPEER